MIKIDKFILILVITLSFLGLINFFSASYYFSLKNFNNPYFYFTKFLLRITILGAFLFLLGNILAKNLTRYKKLLVFLFVVFYFSIFLAFLPMFRLSSAGAFRWVNLGFISFQPSEIIKPLAILIFIFLFSGLKKFNLSQKIFIFTISSLILLLPIYFQPSLSNVLIILFSILIVFVNYLGSNKEIIFSGLVFLFIASALILFGTFWSYRKERFLSFLSKGEIYQEKYFQVEQAISAVSSGGLFGKGLGKSEIKIIGLPQMLTDFIFAIYAEETGFFGSLILIFLFLLLIFRIILIGAKSNNWRKPFAFAFAYWLFLQTFLHISSNIGLFVPTGVILPFFSYGPSGQLAIYFSLGFISRDE